jgi:TonB family protein
MKTAWMWPLIESTMKGSLAIAAAGLAAHLSKGQSAAVRHRIWAAAALAVVLLPILSGVVPSYQPQPVSSIAPATQARRVAPERPFAGPAMAVSAALQAATGGFAGSLLLYAWIVGCGFGALALALGFAKLAWRARRSEPLLAPDWMRTAAELANRFCLANPPRLLLSHNRAMPLTWGIFRPSVLLPCDAATWDSERMRLVLAHEFAHIQRRDWMVQILGEAGRALYWFNPLVWLCCSRLKQESEQACDDAVLLSGIQGDTYAQHLLQLARTLRSSDRAWSVSLAMARTSHLERRFAAMLNPNLNRKSLSRTAGVLTSFAAVCLLIPLAALNAPAQNVTGKFSGAIYDASGGAVPNATIIVSNAQARTKDMTSSNNAGLFEFSSLNAGQYLVEVLKPGFTRYVTDVQLDASTDRHITVDLQLGTVSERIDVIGQGQPRVAAAPTPQRLKLGGNVQATKVVKMVRPTYPPVAKAAGIEGAVLLEAVISTEGEPLSLRVMNSQIDADLAKSAIESVSQWRWQPTLLNGQPVEVITQITINFSLAP